MLYEVITALLPQTDKFQDQCRRLLQVYIHGHHSITARVGQACRHGRFLAEIARQVDQADPRIALYHLGNDVAGAIPAAIIRITSYNVCYTKLLRDTLLGWFCRSR